MAEIHPMEHKLTEAVTGQPAGRPHDASALRPGADATPAEVAEQARRAEESRPHPPDRDRRMVDIGRGEQTAGRQGHGDRNP